MMFTKMNAESIEKIAFLNEKPDKGNVVRRHYNAHFENGETRALIFFLVPVEEKYRLAGCCLACEEDNDAFTRYASFEAIDAYYIAQKFNLFQVARAPRK